MPFSPKTFVPDVVAQSLFRRFHNEITGLMVISQEL